MRERTCLYTNSYTAVGSPAWNGEDGDHTHDPPKSNAPVRVIVVTEGQRSILVRLEDYNSLKKNNASKGIVPSQCNWGFILVLKSLDILLYLLFYLLFFPDVYRKLFLLGETILV